LKIEISPDKQKAKALVSMAKVTIQRLHEIDLEKYPSNTLIDYYDIIHKLFEAISCIRGVKFKSDGAHQQLIEYVCEEYFSVKDNIFLQEMRDYRNRIHYEGFVVNRHYINSNFTRIEEIIKKLMNLVETLDAS